MRGYLSDPLALGHVFKSTTSFVPLPACNLFPHMYPHMYKRGIEQADYTTAETSALLRKHPGRRAGREVADLEDVVTQSVEQIVRHDADRVDARAWPEQHSRPAELDGGVVHRVEDGHVQLTRLQEWLQHLQRQNGRRYAVRHMVFPGMRSREDRPDVTLAAHDKKALYQWTLALAGNERQQLGVRAYGIQAR